MGLQNFFSTAHKYFQNGMQFGKKMLNTFNHFGRKGLKIVNSQPVQQLLGSINPNFKKTVNSIAGQVGNVIGKTRKFGNELNSAFPSFLKDNYTKGMVPAVNRAGPSIERVAKRTTQAPALGDSLFGNLYDSSGYEEPNTRSQFTTQ